jgi:hypothetical protein
MASQRRDDGAVLKSSMLIITFFSTAWPALPVVIQYQFQVVLLPKLCGNGTLITTSMDFYLIKVVQFLVETNFMIIQIPKVSITVISVHALTAGTGESC